MNSYKKQLFLASSHILMVASSLQEMDSSCKYEECYYKLLKDLECLVLEHSFLLPYIFNDHNFLLVMMSEGNKYLMALDLLSLLLNISIKYKIPFESHEAIPVVEELVSHLHSCIHPHIGRCIIHILLKWAESSTCVLSLLKQKLKNTSKQLKEWTVRGYDTELHHLIHLIKANGDAHYNEHFQQAAVKIQSVYRGYSTRKKLKQLNLAIAKFQRLYRMKKSKEQQKHQEHLKQVDIKYLEIISRSQKLQNLHKLQLKTIGMIPAGDIDSCLQEQLSKQATKIQAVWRGYTTRKKIIKMRKELEIYKAASTIQKQVRKWLAFCQRKNEAKSATTLFTQKPINTDSAPVDILVNHWILHHPVLIPESQQDRVILQLKAKDMLTKFYLSLPLHKKRESQLNTILLQLEADAALLTNPAPFEEVKSMDAKLFSSSSAAVASVAKISHERAIKALNWQKIFADDV